MAERQTPALSDIVPPSPEPQPESGQWFQTESGMFGQFMPSTFDFEHYRQQRNGICYEERTIDFTGRTTQCANPATSTVFDPFTHQHYPVCARHESGS